MQWRESFRILSDYLRYRRQAVNEFKIHSPFVFELATAVLYDTQKYDAYQEVEAVRKRLLQDKRKIVVQDLGAGSRQLSGEARKVVSIAQNSLKSAKYAQLLYRIAKYYEPQNILELGTSLGITTSYLARAYQPAQVVTMEGAANIAAVARENFQKQGLERIKIIEGNFDNQLAPTLKSIQRIDLAYIDGNHKKAPTLSYFEQILPYTHNDSIIIFDDIYWSKEMKEAWSLIVDNQHVTISIDLFQLGIVFFRQESKAKQHFQLLL